MLIYYSTAGETVIIVFLNVVVHQKRDSIETLAKKYFSQTVYVLLLDGAPKGDFNFSFTKKMR